MLSPAFTCTLCTGGFCPLYVQEALRPRLAASLSVCVHPSTADCSCPNKSGTWGDWLQGSLLPLSCMQRASPYFSTLLPMLIVFTGFIRVLAPTVEKSICSFLPHTLENVLSCAKLSGQNFFSRQIPLRPFNCKSCCGILLLFKKKKARREKLGMFFLGMLCGRHNY